MQHFAPFLLTLNDRRRVSVDLASADTTLADVIDRLGAVPRPAAVAVDGRLTATAQLLSGSGVRNGSHIELDVTAAVGPVPRSRSSGPRAEAVWVAGPDAGGRVILGSGTHVIGRAPTATVRCDDRTIELHHALIEIDGRSVRLLQLAGLPPITVGGATVSGRAELAFGQQIEIGSSVLVVREAQTISMQQGSPAPARRGDPWRSPFVRSPRARVPSAPADIEVPRTATSPGALGGGLLPTLLGVAGAAALALVFHQMMFLLFGLMGAVVALGTWVAQRIGFVRSRAGVADANRRAVAQFSSTLMAQRDAARDALVANASTLDGAVAAMADRSPALWSVRPTDPDAFEVSIGLGDGFWQPPIVGIGNASAEMVGMVDAASRLGVVPVIAQLTNGTVTALVGDLAAVAVARSMILQLAARSGPADWRLAVVSDRPSEWDALSWLGQITDVGRPARLVSASDVDSMVTALDERDGRHLVVVVDGPGPLHSRTGALRRLLAGPTSTAGVVICATEAEVPAAATSALIIGRAGTARWTVDTRVCALAEPVRIAGISARRADECAASIADLVDPEQVDDVASLPAVVSMTELLGGAVGADPSRFAHSIVDRWSAAAVDPPLRCPLGIAADGVVDIDLVRDGPHALIAGTTGSGKSELLRSLVLGLATGSSPDHVSFVLIDYKGGSTFDACVDLPHVVGVVTDLDDRLAARALRSLEAELRRREHLLREAGVSDLAAYRTAPAGGRSGTHRDRLPRLVVIVDEFASLAVQLPEFMNALLGIAQRGRSLGVHLLLATQRPNGVITDGIRANTNLRISLRVQDPSDAVDVVGDATPARLPRSVPGRAVMRLGIDELITFQTACCSGPHRPDRGEGEVRVTDLGAVRPVDGRQPVDPPNAVDPNEAQTELSVVVGAIVRASRLLGIAAPHRPWHQALTTMMSLADLPEAGEVDLDVRRAAIGIVDDPDRQRRSALAWPVGAGHLVLAGSTGSGTTTALLSLCAALGRGPGAATELFVIDALGDARFDALESAPWLVALVRLHQRERVLRVLDHLCGLIAARKIATGASSGDVPSDVVVLIDGLGALRAELETDEQWQQLEQLDMIVTEGLAAGVRVAMTVTRCSAVPSRLLSQIAGRWVFHLADPLDAALLGVAARAAPPDIAGRLVDAASGCEAQIVWNEQPFAAPAGADGPVAGDRAGARDGAPSRTRSGARPRTVIAELPASIDLDHLPGAVVSRGDVLAPVGLAFDTMRSMLLPIASGEHVLVIGPSRSGRTTALRTIAERWQGAHHDAWVGCIAARRSSARVGVECASVADLCDVVPADRPVLVVIDDAELVDDPAGALASRITSRTDGFTVLAAGRPEALRASYGHWTMAVRRSRLGLVMAMSSDLDADLLGVVLPRRLPVAARPGLAWLVAEGERHLVQIARTAPVDERDRRSLDVAGAVP